MNQEGQNNMKNKGGQSSLRGRFHQWFLDKKGGPSIETVAIIVFVVLVLFSGLSDLGGSLNNALTKTSDTISAEVDTKLVNPSN
ncbi:hypothetical protein GTO91_15750 [Heliobacterium undosum]|uniref:Uncharacterized protein n=1 Tax=Heliomicrobium undosum TaxID=121734 RepID=A0A845LE17_9FIRM|nr:Flp family type IVb pilin [Heliomicrobium undosum]MZP31161.1 hypothetical protein [Heliomicrobium undosum]